jgi:hypothetical protein
LKDPIYAERHIRQLVQVFEGQVSYFIKKYRALLEERLPQTQPTRILPSFKRRGEFIVTSRIIAWSFFVVCVGFVAGYLLWQARAFQSVPSLLVTAPLEGVRLSSPHVEIRGTASGAVSVNVNGRPAIVDNVGSFSLTLDVPRGLTTLIIEARRRYGAPAFETRRVTYEPEMAGTQTSLSAFLEERIP